jgi:hypothetical protein
MKIINFFFKIVLPFITHLSFCYRIYPAFTGYPLPDLVPQPATYTEVSYDVPPSDYAPHWNVPTNRYVPTYLRPAWQPATAVVTDVKYDIPPSDVAPHWEGTWGKK